MSSKIQVVCKENGQGVWWDQNNPAKQEKTEKRKRNKMLEADETIPFILGKIQAKKKHEWGNEGKKEHRPLCAVL